MDSIALGDLFFSSLTFNYYEVHVLLQCVTHCFLGVPILYMLISVRCYIDCNTWIFRKLSQNAVIISIIAMSILGRVSLGSYGSLLKVQLEVELLSCHIHTFST